MGKWIAHAQKFFQTASSRCLFIKLILIPQERKQHMSNTLKGVFPPAVTLFDEKGGFDWEANEKQADFLIEKGVDGIAYFGTNGEAVVVDTEQKKEFLRHMKDYVNGRVKIIAGIGDTCVDRVFDLLAFCEELQLDGVLVVNPYFTVYSDEMIVNYYTTLAARTKLPVIIYNFPSLSGYCFNVDVVKRIVEKSPNVIGLKDTIDNLAHLRSLLAVREIRPDFVLFAAFENQFLPALTMGIDSFISATGTFAPELTINLIAATRNNDYAAAAKWYNQIMRAMDVYACASPLLLACKEAVCQRVVGRSCHEKLPSLPLSVEAKERVRTILASLDLRNH